MREVDEAAVRTALARYVDSEPRVVVAGNHATPFELLAVIDAVLPRYRLVAVNGQPGLPEREGVVHETPFVGPGVRRSPRLQYLPARLSLVPAMFGTTLQPDIVLLHTTPPRGGELSLGIEVNILPAAIEAVRARGGLALAQVNEQMPWTSGDAVVPVEHVALGMAASRSLARSTVSAPSATSEAIADRISELVPSGATLQMGIGAVPDAVLGRLLGHRGLRVWTEMFSDGILALERAGALDPDAPVVASFLFGGEELLSWVDGTSRVRMLRTEKTNDPGRIARQPAMTAINTALEVDLFGQANACWVGGRIYSGLGGQSDFVAGSLHAPGGQALLALPSWHPRADRSTIVSTLSGPVTSFQHSWVVSENGRASIWPQPQREQTRQLIDEVAHPDAREGLREAADAGGLLPG